MRTPIKGVTAGRTIHVDFWVPFTLSLMAVSACLLSHRPLLRLQRLRKGQCLECGYHLIGLPAPRCPECGKAFDPPVGSDS